MKKCSYKKAWMCICCLMGSLNLNIEHPEHRTNFLVVFYLKIQGNVYFWVVFLIEIWLFELLLKLILYMSFRWSSCLFGCSLWSGSQLATTNIGTDLWESKNSFCSCYWRYSMEWLLHQPCLRWRKALKRYVVALSFYSP